jgi:gamma-glutamyl phosphate reductase
LRTEIEAQAAMVLAQNALDIADGRSRKLSDALLDRLLLTEARLARLAADARKVAALPDPVGSDIESRLLPNGMRLSRRRIPIGVLGVIYEARPNVTIDIATLSLKTGNAAILRGGSETCAAIWRWSEVIQAALAKVGAAATAVQYIANPDRALVAELLRLDRYVDMIIPRGGAGLHRLCIEQSTIPVITGGIGICHIFVDDSADLDRAVDIVENAKVQRPSVCNALDTVLVHRAVAERIPAHRRRTIGPQRRGIARHAGTALDILQRTTQSAARGQNRARRPGRFRSGMAGAHFGRQDRVDTSRKPSATFSPQHRTHGRHSHQRLATPIALSAISSAAVSSTPARASTTAGSLAWARKWPSAPKSCTPAARWGWRN